MPGGLAATISWSVELQRRYRPCELKGSQGPSMQRWLVAPAGMQGDAVCQTVIFKCCLMGENHYNEDTNVKCVGATCSTC